MQPFPFRIVLELFRLERTRRFAETMAGEQQLLFPLRGRGRDGFPQRKAFDPAPGLGQFNQFVAADVSYVKPALFAAFDQAVGGQPIERLAQWRLPGLIHLGEEAHLQFSTGLQPAGKQIVPQAIVDRARLRRGRHG